MHVLICDERDLWQALLAALAGARRTVCTEDELLARFTATAPDAVLAGDSPGSLAAVHALLISRPEAAVLVALTGTVPTCAADRNPRLFRVQFGPAWFVCRAHRVARRGPRVESD